MPYQKLINLYQTMLNSGDPRMNPRPLVSSPIPCIMMTLAYLYFVKIGGPRWMKDRPPFGLRNTMIAYNFAMVLVSGYMFIEMGRLLDWGLYCLKCQTVDKSATWRAQQFLDLGYLFYLSKYFEFADTVFFVLRKKYSQVSALHVYHHSVVPLTMCLGMKYEPGGNNSLFPFLNSGVHTIMYTYYGLSALGPRFQKYLFFKRYITTIQLTQFVLVFLHSFKILVEGCGRYSIFLYVNFFHAIVFFLMFTNFYRQSYAKKMASKLEGQQKRLINGQLVDERAVGKDGLRFRTVVDENCNTTTVAGYSGVSIIQKKNGKGE